MKKISAILQKEKAGSGNTPDFEEELVLTVVDSPVDVDFGVVDEPRSMGEEVLLGLAATDLSEVLTE